MATTIEWWRWLLLILMMGGLLGLWAWINRGKWNPRDWIKPVNRRMQVLEKQWLSPKVHIALIEVDREQFLLSYTPTHCAWQKLSSVSPDPIPHPPSKPS